jgi:hypothetical protein
MKFSGFSIAFGGSFSIASDSLAAYCLYLVASASLSLMTERKAYKSTATIGRKQHRVGRPVNNAEITGACWIAMRVREAVDRSGTALRTFSIANSQQVLPLAFTERSISS